MCGRAVLANPFAIREWFDLDDLPDLAPRFNIAPTQPLAVIRTPRRLELLHWGIVRPDRPPQINVRIETIARSVNRQRRCLVVIDGIYEWKRNGTTSQPFVIRHEDGRPFAVGGIWSSATATDGEVVESVAIVTCPPRPPVDAIHDRMPLLIPRDGYARWLDLGSDVQDLLAVGETSLVATPVSTLVNSPRNDDLRCIAPAPLQPTQGALFS